MLNKRILMSAISIVSALTLAGGATFAFFTSTANSQANTFTAGTMNITVDQTGLVSSPVVSDWKPGDETVVRFNIVNSGSIPVNLKAHATGNWVGVANPDPTSVLVTKVEYFDGATWQTIQNSPTGITGDVYYSPDGSINSLFALNGGATLPIRLTVKFNDNVTSSDYQGKSFNAVLTADAKQTNAPTF